ncbi:MAG TPA: alpha-amylase family protein, partial [Mycobacteriales bacterium]|nr:alpha-amylase family protein [Mycobacteriales bacterium]
MAEPAPWWMRPYRTFQTNLREIDAGLDVPAVLDHLERIGADTWLLNTAGIVSFYPSALDFQHPSPWLRERPSGDLIGDAIAAAHERGVHVLSRVDFSKIHRDIAERHPDWCFVAADGRRQIYNGLYSTCPSGPYYQERSFDILGEVLDRYPVDGFFFNWFGFNVHDYSRNYYGICQCSHCRRRFTEEHGLPLPTVEDRSDPAYRKWQEYTRSTLAGLAGRIRDFIAERSPGTPLILGENPDIKFYEANNAVDRERLWVHGTGEAVRASRTADPDRPVWVNSVMFLDIPYRFVVEQPGQLRLYLAQAIAYGANPSAYLVGTPDRFAAEDFALVADLMHFHRDHQDVYDGLRSAADVVLLSSSRYYPDDRAMQAEFRGAFLALTEEHIPFDIRPVEGITAEALSRYAVAVLPNTACLADAECAALDSFAAAGGGLVATFDTAGFDPDGNARPELGLRSLGARRVIDRRGDVRSAYLRVTDVDDLPGAEAGRLVMLDRAYLTVEPRPQARPSLAFIPPSVYGPPEKCYWDIETAHPGLLWHRHGEGEAAYLPWPVGRLYYEVGLPEHRRLLARAVQKARAGRPLLTTDAPPQVELAVGRQGDRTVVHLINYSGHSGRTFHEPLTIADIAVRFEGAEFSRARSLRLDAELPIVGQVVTLPRLDGF